MFRYLSLAAAVVAGVQLAWAAPMAFDLYDISLERAIRFLEVTAVATLLFAAMPIGESSKTTWGHSARQMAVTSGFAAILGLTVVLGIELSLYVPHEGVPIGKPQVAVVAAILVALIAGLITLAVRPGVDPLRLSERGRTLYVYAAEAVGGLLFLHVYLTQPGLVRAILAVVAVHCGWHCVCRCRHWGTVSSQTACGAWRTAATNRDVSAAVTGDCVLGRFRRRSVQRIRAVAVHGRPVVRRAGDFPAIAVVLNHRGIRRQHGAVVAVWVLRFVDRGAAAGVVDSPGVVAADRGATQSKTVKRNAVDRDPVFLGTYHLRPQAPRNCSSTVRKNPKNWWHPIVLAALSIGGILAGMLMRVRAYLYLGTSFLLLALISMVWHAARSIDQAWPWWAFGIFSGVALLAMFGLFEKKRDEVLRTLRRLREWEA